MAPRLHKRLVQLAVLAVVGWLGSSAWVSYRLVRRPQPRRPEPVPEALGGRVRELRVATADGEDLGAWLVEPPTPRAAVLLLHGHGGSRRWARELLPWLEERDCVALALTLRGYGDSSGDGIDFGWSSRHDVLAAVALLEERFPHLPVVLVGQSVGSAGALFAAEELDGRVAGWLLESPYRDLRGAVWHRLQLFLPPGLDWLAHRGLLLWSPLFLGEDVERIRPIDHAAAISIDSQVVVLHGAEDRRAPLAEAEEILVRVRGPAHLVPFAGAGHVDLRGADATLYFSELERLLDGVAPRAEEP